MEKVFTSDGLQNAIQSLEIEQAMKWQQMKAQFHSSNLGLTPSSLLRNVLTDAVTSPYILNKTIGTAVGLASGYILEKMVVGATSTLFRKLIGSLIRIGVTKISNRKLHRTKSP